MRVAVAMDTKLWPVQHAPTTDSRSFRTCRECARSGCYSGCSVWVEYIILLASYHLHPTPTVSISY
jgi:hypothetical protein